MRWLVRLAGDDERHVADLPETEDDAPAEVDGHTECGLTGRLVLEQPLSSISRDELTAAALGVCPRCLGS